jgi:hypothetical protein
MTRKSMIDMIFKLDKVSAVNLAEPIPTDLERITKAYREVLKERDQLKKEMDRRCQAAFEQGVAYALGKKK